MSLQKLLDNWRATSAFTENIVAWHTRPAQPADTSPLPPELHPAILTMLRGQGLDALYSHQAEAWTQVQAGRHPVIVTGTASGKSLCYNLPALNSLLHQLDSRALYLFPTKALARDQTATLQQMMTALKLPTAAAAAYDGDTPTAARPAIRKQARLLVTNADMLHTGILPHHARWAEFFRCLRFVIIDEMHTCRGVFGSHVANVLRRLKRIAQFYGAAPQFILTSATIANPVELAGQLIEMPVVLIERDGAPKGAKHFIIYNPPVINAELGVRRGALAEGIRLTADLWRHNVQTILFGRSRSTVEILLTQLRATVKSANPAKEIRGYRSGYLPRQRREIEQGLRAGQVRTVVATNALELGIDIGQMTAVVMVGYPGTITAARQQAGRAGRTQTDSLAALVASANPLDQYLARHPAYFFDRSPEQGLINPDNLLILWQHVRCAAFELPFTAADTFGNMNAALLTEMLTLLHQTGDLHLSEQKYFWMADQYPAKNVSLRSASPERVKLLASPKGGDRWTAIGEVDAVSAPWLVHPQAIYLHEGQSYQVDALDLEQYIARLHPVPANYYTEPHRETTVQLVELFEQAHKEGANKAYGELIVTSRVIGYQSVKLFTREKVGQGELSLPPTELQTTGYWLTITTETVEALREQGLWTNDPNDYGPNWATQRNQARDRDRYRCQMCGQPEQGRQHDVHHKTPFRQFDSYRQANRLDNLITLCRPCHRRAETAVRMKSGLSGLAFVLGHLAPLFLMCAHNDIAVHAEPDSALGAGQPVIIIYDLAPGGIGFSERLFTLHSDLIQQATELVRACSCADGCPGCVGPAGETGIGGKQTALAILERLEGLCYNS